MEISFKNGLYLFLIVVVAILAVDMGLKAFYGKKRKGQMQGAPATAPLLSQAQAIATPQNVPMISGSTSNAAPAAVSAAIAANNSFPALAAPAAVAASLFPSSQF